MSGILRIVIAVVALSLLIVKLIHKDYHTAIYWGLATLYWALAFVEHLAG